MTQLPELAPRLPLHRKCYMPEDPRTAIFDAAALALTVYARRKRDGSVESVENNRSASGNRAA